MSEGLHSETRVDALIEEFIRLAKAITHFWTVLPDIPERTPERLALKKDLYEVAGELIARGSVEDIRPLFDHESDDVRGFAAGQFLAFDEEWASATVSALVEGLSTREVLALCARARRGPPVGQTLQEMSAEQLAARFEDAGLRRYATRFMAGDNEPWNVELANQIAGETMDLAEEIKSRGALGALLPLLDHPNVAVRAAAADRCLAIAPERARPVLKAIAAGDDWMERDNALSALHREGEKSQAAGIV